MRTLLLAAVAIVRALLIPKTVLALENAALRQQNTVLQRSVKRPALFATW